MTDISENPASENHAVENHVSENYAQRFGGIARLYGTQALSALAKAHMVVIGLGGVGTWTAEALARTGVGEITLIDLDDVCVTNTNRQLHALASTIGQAKTKVLAQRLRDINPEIKINCVDDFIDTKNMTKIIGTQHHVVVDAMDSAHIKSALIAYCSMLRIRLIVIGSSGGKQNPQLIQVDDLGRTEADPILAKIRTQLFRHHNFSRPANNKARKFRVDAVFSTEQMVYPKPDGNVCMSKHYLQEGVKLDCAGGIGSSVMVTGTFGFVAAARAVERYLEVACPSPSPTQE